MTEPKQVEWNIGDRFIFVVNLASPDSDTLPIGYKGIVEEIYNNEFVFCDGWAFGFDEIKKILTVKGDMGSKVKTDLLEKTAPP